jgi:hypothetical protein
MDHDYTTHHDYNPYLEGVPRGRRGSDANEGGSDDDSLRSVSSASTVDSSVTVSTDGMLDDTSPSDFVDLHFLGCPGDYVDLHFLGWPPTHADDPDERFVWFRPERLFAKSYMLQQLAEQYHFAAVAIVDVLRAKPWIDTLTATDLPPAVSRYRQAFAAVDPRLGDVNVDECYCPPICFTTHRDRVAWTRIPARFRPRKFNTPSADEHSLAACCGLLREPLDTTWVLQPCESDDSDDDEEIGYMFAEERRPGIRCLAPRGRAALADAPPQSGWR